LQEVRPRKGRPNDSEVTLAIPRGFNHKDEQNWVQAKGSVPQLSVQESFLALLALLT